MIDDGSGTKGEGPGSGGEIAQPHAVDPLEAVDPIEVVDLKDAVEDGDVVGNEVEPYPADDGTLTTEWFSLDEGPEPEELPALPRREHHVTAVVVSHDGAVWLPAVLTTLASQSRLPDTAVGIDTGSQDDSPRLLLDSFGPQRSVLLDEPVGFGEAVREGLERLASLDPVTYDTTILRPLDAAAVSWVWLLHDDSAPDLDCLQNLLDTADDHPSAAILGPKILGWHDRRLLLEVGVTVTGGGRRITGLERQEHDQGQHDGVRDVLSVSSAGMLVRRDVWDTLGGFDPELPLFRDDLDLCWRAHRMGERVIIATDAVLHHREASAHGRRPLGKDDLRPHRADRAAAVHALLAHATPGAAPFVALRLFLASAIRSVGYALGKDVRSARDEVGAVLSVALQPGRVTHSRALIANTSSEPAGVVRPLRASTSSQVRAGLETLGGIITTSGASAPTSSVSALDSGPVGDDADYLADSSSGLVRRLLLRPSVLAGLLLTLIAVIGTRGLWLGDGVLQGGALLPAPEGSADLWQLYKQTWHDVGPGSTTTAPPYLAVLSALAWLLLGKAPAAVTVAMLLGIPIAGWAAYMALRGLVANRWIRVWAGLAYALLPAMTGAVATGRIGTMISAVALPFAIRSLVRVAGPRGTVRRAAGTAMLVAIVLAATPLLWLALLLATIVGCGYLLATKGRTALSVLGRLALGMLVPLVLLLPWSLDLLLTPSMWFWQPGLSDPAIVDQSIAPWAIALLHPGGLGMTPLWFTGGLVLGGFLAFLRRDRMLAIGMLALAAGIALALGLVQASLLVTLPGEASAMRTWPGPATLLLGGCVIAMGAVAMDGLRQRFIDANFTLGQPLALVAGLLALLAPVLSAGWWVTGQPMALIKASPTLVPAFVAADSLEPQAPRTLMLHDVESGRVDYTLLNGPGLTLGDADLAPGTEAWSELDALVADVASGRGGSEIEGLAGYGIRYVVLTPNSSRDLVPTLDGEPGLRRLSSAGGEVLWRVAGVTSRARLVDPKGGAEPLGLAAEGTVTADPYLEQALPDGPESRTLVIGAQVGEGWRAVATAPDGSSTPLAVAAGPGQLTWSQAFEVPAGAPIVAVSHDTSARDTWLWLQFIVLAALIVMALPERRMLDPDPDGDDPDPDGDDRDPVLDHDARKVN